MKLLDTKDSRIPNPENKITSYLEHNRITFETKINPLRRGLHELSSVSSELSIGMEIIDKQSQSDSNSVKQFWEVIAVLPEERKQRNEKLITNDFVGVLKHSNQNEKRLINYRQEHDLCFKDYKDEFKELTVHLKHIYIERCDADLKYLSLLNLNIAGLCQYIQEGLTANEEKLKNNQYLEQFELLKKNISQNYCDQTNGKKVFNYNHEWKPFSEEIKRFSDKNEKKQVQMLYSSFHYLILSIESCILENFPEKGYSDVIEYICQMDDKIRIEEERIEQLRTDPNLCNHDINSDYIKHFESIFARVWKSIRRSFYGEEMSNISNIVNSKRANFNKTIHKFRNIQKKFSEYREASTEYEYWDTLSQMIFDFIERVYSSNVDDLVNTHQNIVLIMRNMNKCAVAVEKLTTKFKLPSKKSMYEDNSRFKDQLLFNYNKFDLKLKSDKEKVPFREYFTVNCDDKATRVVFPNQDFNMKPQEYQLALSPEVMPVNQNINWKFDKLATQSDARHTLKEDLDSEFHYFIKDSKFKWIRDRNIKIPKIKMEDYINLFIRQRTLKYKGSYYNDFRHCFWTKNDAVVVQSKPLDPPVSKSILKTGFGKTENEEKIRVNSSINIILNKKDEEFRNAHFFMNSRNVMSFSNEAEPTSFMGSKFIVYECINAREYPNYMSIDFSYWIKYSSEPLMENMVSSKIGDNEKERFDLMEGIMRSVIDENDPFRLEKDPKNEIMSDNPIAEKIAISQYFNDIKAEKNLQSASKKTKEVKEPTKRQYLGDLRKPVYANGELITRERNYQVDGEDIFEDVKLRKQRDKMEEVIDVANDFKEQQLDNIQYYKEKNLKNLKKIKSDPLKYAKNTLQNDKDSKKLYVFLGVIALLFFKMMGY